MPQPLVAIIGRPNVGKSTFFNKLTETRTAIVFNTPGVTRDRIYGEAEWRGKRFDVVDTGGIELNSQDDMWMHIRTQAEIAIDTADLIIFMVDYKSGLTADDYDVANFLRKSKKPIVLAVNKVDNYVAEATAEFFALGLGQPIAISSEQKTGIGDLLDEVVANFPVLEEQEDTETIKLAVIGKPNAGKSSIVNNLLGYERCIVSDIAGTTRDALNTKFSYNDQNYLIIDTAGMRKKSAVEFGTLESYSVLRALDAVRRCDVCLLVVDATQNITEQDVKLAGFADAQGKPVIVVFNKWDLVDKDTHTIEKYNAKMREDLSYLGYFRSLFVSAVTGQRINKILEYVNYSYSKATKRVTTGLLNECLIDAVSMNEPPVKKGRRLKIYYITQAQIKPPTFIVFVNDTSLVQTSYRRYLQNNLRKTFDFDATPIRIFFRSREEDKD